MNLVQEGEAIPLKTLRTTSEFFRVCAMDPAMGRGFNARDTIQNAPGVVVISDAMWRERFASGPNILGKAITLGNHTYSIIGVARPEFRLDTKVDVWIPLSIVESPTDQAHQYNLVARLRSDVSHTQAQADIQDALLQLKNTYPVLWDQHESVRAVDFHDSLVGDIRPALEILMGAVVLVLVIVSSNILSLLAHTRNHVSAGGSTS